MKDHDLQAAQTCLSSSMYRYSIRWPIPLHQGWAMREPPLTCMKLFYSCFIHIFIWFVCLPSFAPTEGPWPELEPAAVQGCPHIRLLLKRSLTSSYHVRHASGTIQMSPPTLGDLKKHPKSSILGHIKNSDQFWPPVS